MREPEYKGDRERWYEEVAARLRREHCDVGCSPEAFLEVVMCCRLAGCGVDECLHLLRRLWPRPAWIDRDKQYWTITHWLHPLVNGRKELPAEKEAPL